MDKVHEYYDYVLPLIVDAGKALSKVEDIEVEFKDSQVWDLVTIYDRKIEEILIDKIKEKYPTHKFIGEEETDKSKEKPILTDAPTWIIDPIDGTANFVRNMPISCISVGLTIDKEQLLGIVYNPFMDELFTAIKGEGAYLNGKRIRTSGCKDIRKSVLNYEITIARRNDYYYNMYMFRFKHLIKIIQGVRSMGCGVLGLCYVACARTDAYQCDGLYPWDAAAGTLIVREAGGYVIDSSGKDFDLMDPNFLATATKELSDEYLKIERIADEEQLTFSKLNKPFSP
ncbi:inositol monophosphatase 2-like [Sitophilus oryzae]|uniref:Inositol-1-monophosphatase n=1 Tax=Sitophilus oryzae TaxID=7048 RepID=A0A6J2Y572_SITOR|nr:inositol monophosphatase 2-like [Sitophilus oryzae]